MITNVELDAVGTNKGKSNIVPLVQSKFTGIQFFKIIVQNFCSFVMADHLCSKFQVSITPAHLPELPEQPAGIVIPPIVPRMHTPLSEVAQVTSGIQSISIGRGRGRGLSSLPQEIRQPKMVGRGMN